MIVFIMLAKLHQNDMCFQSYKLLIILILSIGIVFASFIHTKHGVVSGCIAVLRWHGFKRELFFLNKFPKLSIYNYNKYLHVIVLNMFLFKHVLKPWYIGVYNKTVVKVDVDYIIEYYAIAF